MNYRMFEVRCRSNSDVMWHVAMPYDLTLDATGTCRPSARRWMWMGTMVSLMHPNQIFHAVFLNNKV